jgi:O-antigen ligase
MYTEHSSQPASPWIPWLIALVGIVGGIAVGMASGTQPLILGVLMGAVLFVTTFFLKFEYVVIGLLILRAAIDCFATLQLPTLFAIGLNALTILYLTVQAFQRKKIETDWFFWWFLGWWLFQGLWLVLMAFGGLGLGAGFLGDSLREWIRIFSWVIAYLLAMQMKGKIQPKTLIYGLFWSLLLPLTVAILQIIVPNALPGDLNLNAGSALKESAGPTSEGARIRGTLGHPNAFVTYIFMFMSLTQWRLAQEKNKLFWGALLALLAFFYVSAKALYSLMMLAVLIPVLIAPRLSVGKMIAGILFFVLVISLFGSTEFGQERLGSIAKTPLLNPDIDVTRAILLSKGDNNSFNWRIAQWYQLLGEFNLFPWFGYGMGVSIKISTNDLLPHNDYVRALVEGGVVGFVSFISFLLMQIVRLVQLWRNAWNHGPQRDFCLALLAIFMALPVAMLTENIWTHTMLFFYLYTLMAIAGWNWDETATKTNGPKVLGQNLYHRG